MQTARFPARKARKALLVLPVLMVPLPMQLRWLAVSSVHKHSGLHRLSARKARRVSKVRKAPLELTGRKARKVSKALPVLMVLTGRKAHKVSKAPQAPTVPISGPTLSCRRTS